MALSIRPAAAGDAPEVARLAAELGYPTTADEMQIRLTRLIADPAHHVVVATGDNGVLHGWMHIEDRFSLEGGARVELMGLVIDASVRRQRIGLSLLKLAEAWAAERGRSKITVRSNVVRTMSHPFYESCGYEREKTQHVYSKAISPDGGREMP